MKLNSITKAVLLASLTSITSHVFAQQDTASEATVKDELKIEKITVTARKFKESSQEVPVSMSVITSEALDSIAAFDFQDLSKLAPGLEITGDDAISGTIKMRGVGRDAFAGNMDDSVVVFIDGVAQTSVGAAFGSLSDIARVEVLRGPQGTLYGKNAPAGAINITTKSIDMYEIGGGFSSSHFYTDETSTYGTSNKAHVNIPLIEGELGMRISAFYDDDDGYIHNDFLDKPANDSKREGARVKIQYIPNDNLDITFIGNYSDSYNGRVFSYIPGFGPDYINKKDGAAQGTIASADTFESTLGSDIPLGSPDDFRIFSDIADFSKTRLKDAQLNFNYDTESHSLTSITYYQEVKTQFVSDQNGTPITDGLLEIESNQNLFSQELRLSNIDNDTFDYLLGFYYSKLEGEGPKDGSASSTFSQYGATQFLPGLGFTSVDRTSLISAEAETESFGYFAHLNYHLNDEWTVSGGLRYNDETKTNKADFSVLMNAALFPGFEMEFDPVSLPGIPKSSETYTNVSGSFKLQYKQNEDVMYYLALDTAYRSGGFNMSTVAPMESIRTFEPEDSRAIEIGMKGQFFDQRLQWNIDVYYQVFEDYQFGDLPRQDNYFPGTFTDIGSTDPVNAITLAQTHVLNAEEAVSQGIETDFIYLISSNFVLSGALTYIDTEYKEFMGFCDTGEGPTTQMFCDFSGRGIGSNFGVEPASWSTNLHPLYHTDVNAWGVKLSNSLQINYDDVKKFRADYHLGFEPLDGDWSVKFFVKNLFDRESGNVRKMLVGGSTDTYSYDSVRPRQIGLTFGYNF
ncbi:TonB-dependent receptor [Candidatus Colwellia aromaticivorans]|uniref:TonB-dependent receptor n=1 Tax=Candidatus Colwellia aromaticivorans TaxID=2267621 RepID=UPI000DF41A24|nr:TonB-dependent receptor [Candidatus Colwellia aromaticivorans]